MHAASLLLPRHLSIPQNTSTGLHMEESPLFEPSLRWHPYCLKAALLTPPLHFDSSLRNLPAGTSSTTIFL